MMENGADITSVQELMGYTDIESAQLYLQDNIVIVEKYILIHIQELKADIKSALSFTQNLLLYKLIFQMLASQDGISN